LKDYDDDDALMCILSMIASFVHRLSSYYIRDHKNDCKCLQS